MPCELWAGQRKLMNQLSALGIEREGKFLKYKLSRLLARVGVKIDKCEFMEGSTSDSARPALSTYSDQAQYFRIICVLLPFGAPVLRFLQE